MSWLDNIEREFKYQCGSCDKEFILCLRQSDPAYRDPKPCECGGTASYTGFLPIKMLLRARESFDQNGRKAYAVRDGKGGVRYISGTRHVYQETGDIRPQYTPAYEAHLRKSGKDDLLETTTYKEVVDSRKKIAELKEKIKSPATHTQAKEDGHA